MRTPEKIQVVPTKKMWFANRFVFSILDSRSRAVAGNYKRRNNMYKYTANGDFRSIIKWSCSFRTR